MLPRVLRGAIEYMDPNLDLTVDSLLLTIGTGAEENAWRL